MTGNLRDEMIKFGCGEITEEDRNEMKLISMQLMIKYLEKLQEKTGQEINNINI